MRAALATPALRRLATSWAAVTTAGWALTVALAVYAFDVGGATAVGIAGLVRMLPAAVASPITGWLVDRRSRRAVLLWLTAGRAAALAGMAALAAVGAPAAAVFALAAVATVLWTGHKPAQGALLPALAASPGQLAATNAVWGAIESAGFLAGALIGGVLVAATSTAFAFATTAALFAIAAAAVAALPADDAPAPAPGARPLAELAAGARTVARDGGLRLTTALMAVSTLAEGAIDVLVVVVALDLLALGEAGVGWLNAAWGAGGIAGGVAGAALLRRGRLAAGFGAGAVLAGLPLVALAAAPATAVAVGGLVVLGVGYVLMEVSSQSLLQRVAADDVLGRAFGVAEAGYWATTGVGAALAPVLVATLGVRGALLAVGAALPLAVAARVLALRRCEGTARVDDDVVALLRAVPLLRPLPLVVVETLAARASRTEVPAGSAVVREGDVGSAFYVVARGELDVRDAGGWRRREGPGGFFGEIALLRACPRTATVTARTPAELVELEGAAFVAAVTGQPRARQAADRVMAARLADPAPA